MQRRKGSDVCRPFSPLQGSFRRPPPHPSHIGGPSLLRNNDNLLIIVEKLKRNGIGESLDTKVNIFVRS